MNALLVLSRALHFAAVLALFGGTAQLLTRGNNTVEGNGTNGSFTGTFMAK